MTPPLDAKVFEDDLGIFWFDEDSVLYAVSKDTPRTLENQEQQFTYIRTLTGNKKVCMLTETTNAPPLSKEVQDYSAREIPNHFIAIAAISSSKYGNIVANIFIRIVPQKVPIKFFNSQADAKEWLNQFIDHPKPSAPPVENVTILF